MTRVAINGELPDFDLTGFARVVSFKLRQRLHPCSYLWIGRHMSEKSWMPIVLLRYMLDSGMLLSLIVGEAIISYKCQKDVWLPKPDLNNIIQQQREQFPDLADEEIMRASSGLYHCREKIAKDISRRMIGKFTTRGRFYNAKYSSRLITDSAEYDFVIKNLTTTNMYVTLRDAFLSNGKRFGTIVTYIDGENAQYTHLRSSMLAYTTINLFSMINRFPDIAVRVATDSMHIQKKHIKDVEEYLDPCVNWGGWRIKKEILHDYSISADAEMFDKYIEIGNSSEFSSNAPSVSDPVTRYKTVYLNGCGGSGKTTRAIELYKNVSMIVLTPTHRLAREITQRGVKACTYHSFFRYKGDLWTPERMGDKFIPPVVVWDEAVLYQRKHYNYFLIG